MCEIETRELHHQECEIKTGEPHNEECERWGFNDYGEPMDHEEMYPIFL
jgi:hypothetical protein